MASVRVLREHKKLLLLPVLSVLAMVVAGAVFWIPATIGLSKPAGVTELSKVAGYVLLAAGYYALSVVGVFFNAALILAVDQVLRGGDAGIRTALRATLRRFPTILGWALVSCTVSLILRAVDRKVEIAAAVLGFGWSLFAFLALPAVVLGGNGIRQSAGETRELFKRAWICEIAGSIRVYLLVLVLSIPVLPVLFVGLGRATEFSMLTSVAVSALWIGLVALFASTVNGVFRTVVYHYAKTGFVWPPFAGIEANRTVPAGVYPPGYLEWTGQDSRV